MALKTVRAKKGYVMDDLDLHDRRPFRKVLLPSYFDFVMSSNDPFDTHNASVLPALARLFRSLYPYDTREISADCALKVIVRESAL